MKILEAFNFWGLSDRNPTVVDFIVDNKFEMTDSFIGEKQYSNPNYSVSLIFKSVNLFKYYYYSPDEIFTDSIEEGFFIGLNVGDFYGNPNFPFELPFNLTFNDSYDVVKRKLKVRSTKITRLEKSVYCEFNLDKYSILTYFNFNDELIYLKFNLYERAVLIKKQLEKSFKLKDKNIQNENILKLDTVIIDKPTKNWKVRMLEGDTIFNDDSINATSILLDKFGEELKVAINKGSSKSIYAAVRKLIKSINILNDKFNSFIETTEREGLCNYINKCVKATGFKIEDNFDITEEWREW